MVTDFLKWNLSRTCLLHVFKNSLTVEQDTTSRTCEHHIIFPMNPTQSNLGMKETKREDKGSLIWVTMSSSKSV